MMHSTAKVSQEVNSQSPRLECNFTTFNPIDRHYPLNRSTSWTLGGGVV